MDLFKRALPASDEAALSTAADFVGKKDHSLDMVAAMSYPGHKGYMVDFEPAVRVHQELIEALESHGYSVIDGTTEVMLAMLKQAENLALKAIYPEGNRQAVIVYHADWVQASSGVSTTVIVDYHVVVGLVKPNTNELVNMSTVGIAKFPLTQGVTVHDQLFKDFLVPHPEDDEDEDDDK